MNYRLQDFGPRLLKLISVGIGPGQAAETGTEGMDYFGLVVHTAYAVAYTEYHMRKNMGRYRGAWNWTIFVKTRFA